MGRGLRKILLKKGDKKRNVEDYLGKILTSLKYRERSGYGSEPESEDYEFEIEEPSIIPKKVYKKELYELQIELLKLQEWVKENGKKVYDFEEMANEFEQKLSELDDSVVVMVSVE